MSSTSTRFPSISTAPVTAPAAEDFASSAAAELIDRHVLDVTHVVDSDSDPPLEVVDEQDQSFGAPVGCLPRVTPPSMTVTIVPRRLMSPHTVSGAPGSLRHRLRRNDLTKRIHVAREAAAADVEHEQASRRNVRLFLRRPPASGGGGA